MGFKVVGYDVDERMLDRCISNFRHLGISRFSLALQDATTMSSHYDYVVTDLPYGRNSVSTQPIDKLYFDFLSRLKGILGKRAVVVFPDSVDFRPIVRKCGLKVCGEFTHYVHKSLSKRIVVVSP